MYNAETDKKWRKKWEETKLYNFDENNTEKKFYCLEMFSYPSGANLHLGHWYNYGLADVYARFKRMQGYNVFHPMGFDSFGLPAENYAIKTGVHPKDSTEKSIRTMTKQLRDMGATFNWDYVLSTCDKSYYKWTQWLFLQLYKAGLTYRKKAAVNWCPGCKTVLANEQVEEGVCERCKSTVYQTKRTQWFFKITAYADELIDKIDSLDWPEKTRKIQTNWIGRSYGTGMLWDVCDSDEKINVFTTRMDTVMGVTYIVIAPEHDLVDQIVTSECKNAVEHYKKQASLCNEIERLSTEHEVSGTFTGAYCIHPFTGKKLPVWIADYVVESHGTGCVMAVPAHDERDYRFAAKYNLPVVKVIENDHDKLPNSKYGTLINSGGFNGLESEKAMEAITNELKAMNRGDFKTSYRLRDWLVSRQRYWGAPIPIIYCDECGTVPVPEEDLPVELPYNVEFSPNGVSPLLSSEEFLHTKCPKCGGKAKRETDTMDTFVDSSWYFLRYPDPNNDQKAFDSEKANRILPVDKYVGGPEHATMHLLYARFITKVLRDLGYIHFDEPFISLIHQGTILGVDGKRMSKSRPESTVAPDEYIEKFGSDVFRLYLAFGFAFSEGGIWDESGINAIQNFVNKIERVMNTCLSRVNKESATGISEKVNFVRYNSIKAITTDAEKFKFNTCIARLMELLNEIEATLNRNEVSDSFLTEVIHDFIRLLAPFAPHLAEELWERAGNADSVFKQEFPAYDEKALVMSEIELPIQINGKTKTKIMIPPGRGREFITEQVLADEKVRKLLEGKTVRNLIVIPDKIVNIVV